MLSQKYLLLASANRVPLSQSRCPRRVEFSQKPRPRVNVTGPNRLLANDPKGPRNRRSCPGPRGAAFVTFAETIPQPLGMKAL